jgi:DNA helicase HerA-like ATPase
MSKHEAFVKQINEGYTFKKESIILGGAMIEGECQPNSLVKIPLKTINRHGLIAGATGTGKTKSLQVFAEQLSSKGVPVLLMDVKGDLSGLAQPGENNDHIKWRHGMIGIPYEPAAMPVELLTLSKEKGVRLRATVSEFGPVLLSKILSLNEVQSGIMSILFKYCDDNGWPLLDMKDLKKLLQYASDEGRAEIEAEYGRLSSASVNTILRKTVEIEQQGADLFFGERSFDVQDLLRTRKEQGVINIIRLTDIQDRPKMFSTFMLCLLAEVYNTFPEQGDSDLPKLAIFIDEAHLVFRNASQNLMDQLESTIKLIRSKGVGVFFITQNPTDVPDAILAQLGLKIQHALRAFTAKDRKAIKQTAENYPSSDYYRTDELLTEMGIGEAMVTVLNEKGIPTPLAHTLLRAPKSRMDVLTEKEISAVVAASELAEKYNEIIDRDSAFEMLNKKLDRIAEDQAEDSSVPKRRSRSSKKDESFIEGVSKNTMVRQLGRTVIREVTRGLLGVLGIKRR